MGSVTAIRRADQAAERSAPETLARARHVLRYRLMSPLLRRILLLNVVPLALLVVALLYLDQYQDGLLEAEVSALREQARIYANAIGESAVRDPGSANPALEPVVARSLLRRLTEPAPTALARLYGPDSTVIADSRVRDGVTQPMPPPGDPGVMPGAIGWLYAKLSRVLPHARAPPLSVDDTPGAAGYDWTPDAEEIRLSGNGTGGADSRETPPYIRRIHDRLLVTVAEPVETHGHTVGILVLTREARNVDVSLFQIRASILALFVLALALTILVSWYLASTIARPILRLAAAAAQMREGRGRAGGRAPVPPSLIGRRDEVGAMATALAESAAALWARMDAIEQFAADVAHEIKNPLSSIRSAIETLRRVEDEAARKRLLAIIAEDVARMDRLISDISDASRVDAELSRAATEKVDVAPILGTLAEIAEATRHAGDPHVELDAPEAGLVVDAVEGRLVQVLRNLIANARSFSPEDGRIGLRAREAGGMVEIAVEDDGPGIPEAKLEHVFERFYSERPQGEQFGQHSGLGLSISRQIIQALRGRISAENRRDDRGHVVGARFVVRLPRAAA